MMQTGKCSLVLLKVETVMMAIVAKRYFLVVEYFRDRFLDACVQNMYSFVQVAPFCKYFPNKNGGFCSDDKVLCNVKIEVNTSPIFHEAA